MVSATYFDYALSCARELHNLAQAAKETYDRRKTSLSCVFDEKAWKGPAKDEMQDVHTSKHQHKFDDFHSFLVSYRDAWLDSWLEAVDSYNREVRQQTVQELQRRLDAWNAEVWGRAYNESNFLEKRGLEILYGVDMVLDALPGGESRIEVDNAEGLVPVPQAVAGNLNNRPQIPFDAFPRVFVEYTGSTDPTQTMTAHYSTIPCPL